jgi:hypothetical protein
MGPRTWMSEPGCALLVLRKPRMLDTFLRRRTIAGRRPCRQGRRSWASPRHPLRVCLSVPLLGCVAAVGFGCGAPGRRARAASRMSWMIASTSVICCSKVVRRTGPGALRWHLDRARLGRRTRLHRCVGAAGIQVAAGRRLLARGIEHGHRRPVVSRGSYAGWGPSGTRRCNPW